MIKNKKFKMLTLCGVLILTGTIAAQAQNKVITPNEAIKAFTAKQRIFENVVPSHLDGMSVIKGAPVKRTLKRNTEKPGALYTISDGYYNLVPGTGLGEKDNGDVVYAENGVFGYIDRDLKFINKTPANEYDSFVWDFLGTIYEGDTLVMHPYFANNGFYFDTPKLTATYAGTDSIYQMGTYIDKNGKEVPGMVSTRGAGYVYNVDVDAVPFVNTYYNTFDPSDVWNNMLFGWDLESKPYYVENYQAPAGGPIGIWGFFFYLVTPKTTEFNDDNSFTIEWWEMSDDGKEWKTVKTFENVVPEYDGLSNGMRLWHVTANSETPDVLIDNEYCIVIKGPHDGTKWALFAQVDRDQTENAKNTAYFIPTTGDLEGQFCQYTLATKEENGDIVPFNYNSSLDVWQFIVSPYIIMMDESTNFIQETEYDFAINGETRNYMMMNWWGTAASGVKLTATVSNSTDGDWLTVTVPEAGTGTAASLYTMSMTAKAKKFNVKARRATVTIADNMGYSREIIVYQGDRAEADKLVSVAEANSTRKISVKAEGDGYTFICPSIYHELRVCNAAGQTITTQSLAGDGIGTLSATTWGKGVYLLQFIGKGTSQTIKIVR